MKIHRRHPEGPGAPRRLHRRRRRTVRWSRRSIVAAIVMGAIFSHATNPFTRYSVVRDPYITIMEEGNIRLLPESLLNVKDNRFYTNLALAKSGFHILSNVYTGSKKSSADTVESIIDQIHTLRFDPDKPYLISGDHFSILYPRSLGVFYQTTLDPRTARSESDWQHRQELYLKTTAYALQTYAKAGKLSTTILPTGPQAVTLTNFYAYPSDTLYSLLFGIKALSSTSELEQLYPFDQATSYELATGKEASILLSTYKDTLHTLYEDYKQTVYDPILGRVKPALALSGTKDIGKRTNAFYDNVIYWRTTQLAMQLGIIESHPEDLDALKARIVAAYWNDQDGFFLEDLSPEAQAGKYYSSDWLVTLMTGFLNPADPAERVYYERSMAYIQREKINQPFGLKYQQVDRPEREYFFPRYLATSYGGTAIWSHWGMEYIKALGLLYKATGDTTYLTEAKRQITAYETNMLKYKGFPEVYAADGTMFGNFFYRSVRQTGWVVNFEEARALIQSVESKPQLATSSK